MSVISDVPVEDVLPEPETRRRPRGLGLALAVIGSAQLMIVLDGTIVNIALPHIQTDLGFSQRQPSWVVNAYALAFGGLLLLGGRLGDLSAAAGCSSSAWCSSPSPRSSVASPQTRPMLIASRVAQGAGAAIASPNALALITTTFPAGKERNRAMGVFAAMSGAGAAVGLILGGALTEYDWRWNFFINLPIGLLVAILAPRVLAESERSAGQLDVPGAITGTAGLVGLVYGLTHAADPAGGWRTRDPHLARRSASCSSSPSSSSSAATPHALLPIRILADRTRGISLFVMLHRRRGDVRDVLLPRHLHPDRSSATGPLQAGSRVPARSRSAIVAGARSPRRCARRIDPRWIAGPGAAASRRVGMFGFSQLDVDSTYAGDLLPWIVVLAFGLGLIFVPLTLTAVAGVRAEDSGATRPCSTRCSRSVGRSASRPSPPCSRNAFADRMTALAGPIQGQAQSGAITADQAQAAMAHAQLVAQTDGSTRGFLVGAAMILVGSLVIFFGLNVKHEELASREEVAGPHLG